MRRLVVALATQLPFAACSSAPPFDAKAVVQEWAAYMNQDHTLVPGDVLEIDIPDLVGSPSVRVAVSSEGAVSLPKLDRSIVTTNKTVAQFRQEVVEAYRRQSFSVSSVTVTLSAPSAKSVYVCGDAKRMAPDVQKTLVEIVQREGSTSREEAEARVERLKAEGRYIQDEWAAS